MRLVNELAGLKFIRNLILLGNKSGLHTIACNENFILFIIKGLASLTTGVTYGA